MDDIRICEEARAIIGREWRPGDGGYECVRCGQPGESTTPTSLVLLVYRDGGYPSENLAHAGCVPSVVVRAGGRLVIGAEVNPDQEEFLRVRAAILGGGSGGLAWPVLLHEFERNWHLVPPPPVDPDVARLLADGLTLLADGNALAGLSRAGWRLELRGTRARLAAPNGSVYYQGPWNAPARWEDLASQRGGCLLLSGIVGLFRWRAMSAPARTLSRRLGQAARAGLVAGGLVPVVRGPDRSR